ncbi:C3 and PZP-like alpha-2-macroglobulin domain-containing protein 8 [Patiria miniata]|uniref:Farnesoic acid O-methyl transferase domain-containing protein n=1 Tax=Patiria miniata TaxID=46514 RepID=A0A914AVU5_PATMI|nr:C3 and PZP-like alpha-2-macroglobulin domain-containing protein 8 [Patiria miniata]
MPFRLDFDVKIKQGASIALAEHNTDESVFAEINIGGRVNTLANVRPCYLICLDIVATHEEQGLVNASEYRPFWIDYKGGVVRIGKGGQEAAFVEWDAGAYHQRVPTRVHFGVSSWGNAEGYWKLHQKCA